jgi:hypothetical protein
VARLPPFCHPRPRSKYYWSCSKAFNGSLTGYLIPDGWQAVGGTPAAGSSAPLNPGLYNWVQDGTSYPVMAILKKPADRHLVIAVRGSNTVQDWKSSGWRRGGGGAKTRPGDRPAPPAHPRPGGAGRGGGGGGGGGPKHGTGDRTAPPAHGRLAAARRYRGMQARLERPHSLATLRFGPQVKAAARRASLTAPARPRPAPARRPPAPSLGRPLLPARGKVCVPWRALQRQRV